MRPRNLNSDNWDVNVAVFETQGLDVRVTFTGKELWFRVDIGQCCADISLPIKEFRKAVDFVRTFNLGTLTDKNTVDGLRLGLYGVEIGDRIGVMKKGKLVYKNTPPVVMFKPLRETTKTNHHAILIRLSLFKKIMRWYDTDFE